LGRDGLAEGDWDEKTGFGAFLVHGGINATCLIPGISVLGDILGWVLDGVGRGDEDIMPCRLRE
jgi:hypothetical protein